MKEELRDSIEGLINEAADSLTSEINSVLDNSVPNSLEANYILTSDIATPKLGMRCGCEVEFTLANDINCLDSVDMDIFYCSEHDAEGYQEEITKYKSVLQDIAEKIWLADADAKFNPEYRELFRLVGI